MLKVGEQVLEDGAQSIREVAAQYSFASASHFSELFKNAYGVAPKEHISYL
ncbi:AraC family transcriptional regulator [Pedobacter nyackensis]|uniref:AraC family transcriptional regulator n=1 Tax=Pedobacter nyackensis TaxID=475255 RepID=UPI0009FD1FFA|nr:AraC family transcriptional regulator [Pedobacter nyackensis]